MSGVLAATSCSKPEQQPQVSLWEPHHRARRCVQVRAGPDHQAPTWIRHHDRYANRLHGCDRPLGVRGRHEGGEHSGFLRWTREHITRIDAAIPRVFAGSAPPLHHSLFARARKYNRASSDCRRSMR